MEDLPFFDPILTSLPRSNSTESIQIPVLSPVCSSDEEKVPAQTPKNSSKTTRSHHVTTIQEYTQLVIACMKKCKRMNTTEVAKSILGSVRPRTTKLTVNIRRRVGDALSVLTAIRLVEKQGNGYMWTGNRGGIKTNEMNHLRTEVAELQWKLELKRNQYQALVDKETELRQLNTEDSQHSSEVSNTTVCTQSIDDDFMFDFEMDSPKSIHFNSEMDVDSYYIPFIVDDTPKSYPSISFPEFVFGRE